ncbi:MAG: hypothetical protein Ct9H300mP28_26550 [Pseudomonadota bacterium]|nr:MAG: hypothetical protein Ct9H300mP28_26550 [Pseudomonadota bacterium]
MATAGVEPRIMGYGPVPANKNYSNQLEFHWIKLESSNLMKPLQLRLWL